MSVDVIIVIAIFVAILAVFVAFLAGAVFGYGIRVREEQAAYERIRSALMPWHGHTSHKGHTIFSQDVKEGDNK